MEYKTQYLKKLRITQYLSKRRINTIHKMENDTIYHHVKKLMRFCQCIRILPINVEQATDTHQIAPNENYSVKGDFQPKVESKFNVKSACSFKYSHLQFVLNIGILIIVSGLVCTGQVFMFNLSDNSIQAIGFIVFALTLVIAPIAIVFYCNRNTPQLLVALDGIFKVDLKIQALAKELNLKQAFDQGCVKYDQILMTLVCFGYVIALAIDNAFMGEASCEMDLHKMCRKSIIDTPWKSALFMGSISVISQIGVGGFIMLLQNLLLEIKYRVEKIQECLIEVIDGEERRSEDNSFYPIEHKIVSENRNKNLPPQCSDGVSKLCTTIERIRKIHQELMDSLESIMNFAHPQCLFAFTALFLSSLGKMFFATEASTRCMYRHAVSMGCMAFWMILVVFTFCFYSQKFKDQISYTNKILDKAYICQRYFHAQISLFKSHVNQAENGIINVANFFILDNSFFLGFINAIATYFVIMIQFNMGGEDMCMMTKMPTTNKTSNTNMI